jgi:hypothetical protein
VNIVTVVHEGARDEIAVPGLHFCEVKRRPCLKAMVDVVDNVLGCENDVRTNVAKGKMQHGRIVRKKFLVMEVRFEDGCGEEDE